MGVLDMILDLLLCILPKKMIWFFSFILRLMKRLRQKNKRDIDLEKKEKGFTLYLNSSYQDNKQPKSNKPYRAKTASAAGKSIVEVCCRRESRSVSLSLGCLHFLGHNVV